MSPKDLTPAGAKRSTRAQPREKEQEMNGYTRHRAATRAQGLTISPILIGLLLSLALIPVPVRAANPIANDDRFTVDEDSINNRLDVLANDYDPDGDPLKVVAIILSANPKGTVDIIEDGLRVSYTPDPDFYGADVFWYRVDDGKGGIDTARVDVTVRGINDPPDARDDYAVTDEDTPVIIDVLANDSDRDGDLVPSTVIPVSGPSYGSASVNAGTGAITYTPDPNWHGTDTITYRVCDNGTPLPPQCSTAIVTITVREVNDPPVANAGPDQSVKTNAIVTLDGSGSYDIENDLPLQYIWAQTGGPPVVLSNPYGQKTTLTTPGDPCVLTFTLNVIDSRGLANLAPDETVVTVTNRAPVADAGPDQNVPTDEIVRLDGTGSYDPDNDYPLTYLWIQTSGPTVSLSSNTVATPTFIAPSTPSTLTFVLYVRDARGETDLTPDTVQITVYKRPIYYVRLPLISNPIVGPDLVVQSIQATRNHVRVTIRNQGNVAIQNSFFVDVYINPSPPPTRVNQTWSDLGTQGIVWGVSGAALEALVPGASITLEYRDSYYLEEYSVFSGSLSPGTPIYAQVDSFNYPDTGYGTVLETHERLGGTYNNILGPVSSTAAFSSHSLPLHPTDPDRNAGPAGRHLKEPLDMLPPRP